MKAYLEIVELKDEIVTVSTGGTAQQGECCDMGCPSDGDQMAGIY